MLNTMLFDLVGGHFTQGALRGRHPYGVSSPLREVARSTAAVSFKLPHAHEPSSLLHTFDSAHAQTSHSSRDTVLSTFVAGLQLYFEKSLGMCRTAYGSMLRDIILSGRFFSCDLEGNNLLYRFERGQYADTERKYRKGHHVVIGKEKSMSEVYGAEHLLRLIGVFFPCSPCMVVVVLVAFQLTCDPAFENSEPSEDDRADES